MGVYINGITIDWLNRATIDEISQVLNDTSNMVEVKEPHGRLIDADLLIMVLRLEYPMMPMFKELREEWQAKTEGYIKAEKVVADAPTVIESEGE